MYGLVMHMIKKVFKVVFKREEVAPLLMVAAGIFFLSAFSLGDFIPLFMVTSTITMLTRSAHGRITTFCDSIHGSHIKN